MSSSRTFRTLCRRELKAAFRTGYGWVVAAGSAGVVGGLFLMLLWKAEGTVQTIPTLFATALTAALPFLAAFATMRPFAADRASGGLEVLLTDPVSDSAVVLSKFWAGFAVVVAALAATVGSLVVYAELVDRVGSLRATSLAVEYSRTGTACAVATLLAHAAAFSAVGTLVSLLSRRPALAAVGTLALTLPATPFLVGALADANLPQWLASMDVRPAARGLLDTRPIVLSATVVFLALFAAIRVLEVRRWKL